METVLVREIEPKNDGALELSAEPGIRALSQKFASRGLAQSAQTEADAQIRAEREALREEPDAYRLSAMSDAAIRGRYRRGKNEMNGDDLIRYFGETHARRVRNADFSEYSGEYSDAVPQTEEEKPERAVVPASGILPAAKAKVTAVREKIRTGLPTWFDFSAPKKEKKKFPLSALAAMFAVAISLMLIIAGSVMTTRAKSRIGELNSEITKLSGEITEMRSDVNVATDLLEIREIAVEKYGMVGEQYVRMRYLSDTREDGIKAFEEERDGGIGLGAILSAIGLR